MPDSKTIEETEYTILTRKKMNIPALSQIGRPCTSFALRRLCCPVLRDEATLGRTKQPYYTIQHCPVSVAARHPVSTLSAPRSWAARLRHPFLEHGCAAGTREADHSDAGMRCVGGRSLKSVSRRQTRAYPIGKQVPAGERMGWGWGLFLLLPGMSVTASSPTKCLLIITFFFVSVRPGPVLASQYHGKLVAGRSCSDVP